jgi:hypothetical protein
MVEAVAKAVAKFIVPDWGIKSIMALGKDEPDRQPMKPAGWPVRQPNAIVYPPSQGL